MKDMGFGFGGILGRDDGDTIEEGGDLICGG